MSWAMAEIKTPREAAAYIADKLEALRGVMEKHQEIAIKELGADYARGLWSGEAEAVLRNMANGDVRLGEAHLGGFLRRIEAHVCGFIDGDKEGDAHKNWQAALKEESLDTEGYRGISALAQKYSLSSDKGFISSVSRQDLEKSDVASRGGSYL